MSKKNKKKKLLTLEDISKEVREEVITFKLYPKRGSKLYTNVEIWPSQGDLELAYPQQTELIEEEGIIQCVPAFVTGLIVTSVSKDKKTKKVKEKLMPLFALACFTKENLIPEIIAHEMTHVSLRWAERTKLKIQEEKDEDNFDCHPNEEEFCYVLGHLVAQFLQKAHEKSALA